jgi:diadenosine tetraphosphate (Ap4A) HIT family hydrolase
MEIPNGFNFKTNLKPSLFNKSNDNIVIYLKKKKKRENGNTNKCYTCNPRGSVKDHIISQTNNFTFNHDMFRRPLIIVTSNVHYHDINDIPDELKLELFRDIKLFVEFWNISSNYQLMINNGNSQTHHHFHCKIRIDESIANRMRRDHFTRINLEKSYSSGNLSN